MFPSLLQKGCSKAPRLKTGDSGCHSIGGPGKSWQRVTTRSRQCDPFESLPSCGPGGFGWTGALTGRRLKHVEARRSTGAPLITKHQEWRAVPRDVRKFEAFDGHRDDNYEDLGLHSSLCNAFFMPFQSNMFLQAAKANYFVLKHFLD